MKKLGCLSLIVVGVAAISTCSYAQSGRYSFADLIQSKNGINHNYLTGVMSVWQPFHHGNFTVNGDLLFGLDTTTDNGAIGYGGSINYKLNSQGYSVGFGFAQLGDTSHLQPTSYFAVKNAIPMFVVSGPLDLSIFGLR